MKFKGNDILIKKNDIDASKITSQFAIESFKVDYFLCIINHAIASLNRRFEQYKEYESVWIFVHYLSTQSTLLVNL